MKLNQSDREHLENKLENLALLCCLEQPEHSFRLHLQKARHVMSLLEVDNQLHISDTPNNNL